MTALPVQIPPGIVVDDTTFSTGQSAWADADKVRFWRQQPQVIGGWQKLIDQMLLGVCRTVFPWTDNAGSINIAFGTHSSLEVWGGGQLYNITPTSGFFPGLIDGTGGAGFGTGAYGLGEYSIPSANSGGIFTGPPAMSFTSQYDGGTTFGITEISGANYIDLGPPTYIYDALTWSLSDYGENLIANPKGQGIFWWRNDLTMAAAQIETAPARVTYTLVAATRQVMAFGCNEETSGTFNPRCIRFSDIEDPTDWTTSTATNAGEVIIGGSGQIVAARLIGQYIFVWTDNALWLGTYDATSTDLWSFTQQGENCGLIGPNAAVIISDSTAFWMGPNGQIFVCVLGGTPTLLSCPLQADVFDHLTIGQTAKIVASSCTQFAEIRFDYPDSRDGVENSRYFTFNTVDVAWSRGTMVRTAYVDAGPTTQPIGVDLGRNIYWHELGQTADGAAFDAFIETADMYLGTQFVPTEGGYVQGDQVIQVNGVWPDIANQVGNLNITVTARLYPQATERSKGPYTLAPGQSRRDFLIKGRIARVRYESNSAPTFWRLGKPVYDVVPTGIR
jgi:hypothetical protein